MTSSRFAKPFIVAGLTGALALAAPATVFAQDVAAPTGGVAAVPSPRISGAVNYHLTGIMTNGEYALYAGGSWPHQDPMFQLFREQDGVVDRLSEGVTFSSSDESVLWISSDGCAMRTGNAPGTAIITATYQGEAVASLTYQVVEYTGEGPVDTDPVSGQYAFSSYSSTSAIPGETVIHLGSRLTLDTFQVSPADAGGNPAGDPVSDELVKYRSSNLDVLLVNEDGGYIEGVNPGEAKLIATVYDGEGNKLGEASMAYTVPGYVSLLDLCSVYHNPLSAEEQEVDISYGRMGVSGVSYDLSKGPGSCGLSLYVSDRIDDGESNVTYSGITVSSDNEGVVRVAKDEEKDLAVLEFVGSGTATVSIVGNFTVDGKAETITRTVDVTVTGTLSGGGEQGGGQGGQATEEQPTDEQKPADTTDKKGDDKTDKNADKKGEGDLPETGDPALLAVGLSGLAGAGAIGAAAALRRRMR